MGHPVTVSEREKLPAHGLLKATDLIDRRNPGGVDSRDEAADHGPWSRHALSGYLTELVGGPASANLTMAGRLILHAQAAGELVAWVATHRDVFFPPDFAAMGVDLAALPVVWAEEPLPGPTRPEAPAGAGARLASAATPAAAPFPEAAGATVAGAGAHGVRSRRSRRRPAAKATRAAERLLRSGACGLVVIDLAKDLSIHPAGQGRLLRLAEHNDAQVLILRRKRNDGIYSGSLVTVRAESSRRQTGPGAFQCTITNTKDKREGPGWTTSEEFDGPPGLY